MKNTLFLILCAFVLLTSCRKEQPSMNENNNCDCAKEVSADFQMGEKFGDQFMELDTIAMPIFYNDGNPANFQYETDVYVYFSANIKNAISYEWQVGANSITQSTKDFGLYFSDTIGTIPVRLIVHAKPNLICFPNDDGVDTVVKYLTIRNVVPDPLTGKYSGYNTNDPTHVFTIEIDTTRIADAFSPYGYYIGLGIKNLPDGNNNWFFVSGDFGSTTRCFTNAGEIRYPLPTNYVVYDEEQSIFKQSTVGIYDPKTNKITINYYSATVISPYTLGAPFPKRTFIGTKIQ
ncbi:MAG: hypothetical protein RLZZ493_1984 [Bacteroidota bacterium]|jgi:hypothetical protein